MQFVILYPETKKGKAEWNRRFGLNAYWSGKHWTKRKEDAEYWHLLVAAEMNRQKVQRVPFDKPVEITIFFNDRLDIDNHSAMAKMIVDSMKGRVIEDDSRKYVKRLVQDFHDEEYILVVVEEVAVMKKKEMSLEDALVKVQNLRTMFKMLDQNDSRIPALDVAIAVMCEKVEKGGAR